MEVFGNFALKVDCFEPFQSLFIFLTKVPKIKLSAACEPDDECEDHSAECREKACRCQDAFFDRNGVCRKS